MYIKDTAKLSRDMQASHINSLSHRKSCKVSPHSAYMHWSFRMQTIQGTAHPAALLLDDNSKQNMHQPCFEVW
jgi:hypothetical protein